MTFNVFLRVASLRVNITMPAFVIEEMTIPSATLQSSKFAFESSVVDSLNMKTYLQAVSQKCQTVLANLELPHFIETALVHS